MQKTATPRTFDESRNEHLRKSAAFLGAARTRLADNLPYRSALSDAVEAIRHSLQAYLWTRVAALWPREPAPQWQEVAVKGSMPDLLAAATEAGLSFSRSDRETILNLARVRNSYTHDSPHSGTLITQDVADRAVTIADIVDRRVQRAMGRTPAERSTANGTADQHARREPVAPVPQVGGDVPEPEDRIEDNAAGHRATAPAAPAAQDGTGQPPEPAETETETPSAQAPAASEDAPESPVDAQDDGGLTPGEIRALDPRVRRRARVWRVLGAVALLLVGVAVGAAGMYPLARGQVALPAWMPFAANLSAATPTATVAAVAQPTATAVPSTPVFVGDLLVTPSGCGVTPAALTLRNSGTTPVQWSIGFLDAPGASVTSGGGPAHPSLSGTLAPGDSVALTISGLPAGGARAVVVASGGGAELTVGAC